MRRKPPGKLLPSAHAVDREYRVITALRDTDVPVARTYGLCEDESVIGTAFYVMDCVDGRVLWDPQLPGMAPADRRAIFNGDTVTWPWPYPACASVGRKPAAVGVRARSIWKSDAASSSGRSARPLNEVAIVVMHRSTTHVSERAARTCEESPRRAHPLDAAAE